MSTYSLLIAQLLVVVYCCRRLLIRVRLDRLALAGQAHCGAPAVEGRLEGPS